MQDLKNKVAVITGGASGIGFALAAQLGKEGCRVVIADRRADEAEKAAEKLSAEGVQAEGIACDVTAPTQIEALCDQAWQSFGQVDLLFANAGVMGVPGGFLEAPLNEARWMFDVNFFGTWNTVQAFSKRFANQDSESHIVITGSENSICVPVPQLVAYNASKHALLGMAEMLRMELPEQIKISILCPGMVKTALSSSAVDRDEKDGGPQADPFGGKMPFGMEPEQIAEHCIDQVKKDAFYIVTHYSNKYMVEERYQELLGAFNTQTEEHEGWEQNDTRHILAAAQAMIDGQAP